MTSGPIVSSNRQGNTRNNGKNRRRSGRTINGTTRARRGRDDAYWQNVKLDTERKRAKRAICEIIHEKFHGSLEIYSVEAFIEELVLDYGVFNSTVVTQLNDKVREVRSIFDDLVRGGKLVKFPFGRRKTVVKLGDKEKERLDYAKKSRERKLLRQQSQNRTRRSTASQSASRAA